MNTKGLFLLLLVLFVGLGTMDAVPAKRGALKVQQPDGSCVTIRLHGDEWVHFNTTDDGYSVVKDSRGRYVYAQLEDGQLKATSQVAHDPGERSAVERSFLSGVEKYQAPQMTEQTAVLYNRTQQRQAQAVQHRAVAFDKFKGLVILVQFNDKEFSSDYDSKQVMTDLISKEDYTGFTDLKGRRQNFTGSVVDYFSDNSYGKFKPQFDVVGPYTIDFSQYDGNGTQGPLDENGNPRGFNVLLLDAINKADADVNFKNYDADGDGFVDLIYFIFAGIGSNIGGNDARLVWPHRSAIVSTSGYYVRKDNVYLWDYACSTEQTGYQVQPMSIKIEGIGTICHEFSHVLGLPDFYDTDYEGSGGESDHPGDWSLMASGSYLNDSRTPSGYSLYERYAVGFMEDPQVSHKIQAEGSFTLNPLATTGDGYRIDGPQSKEFFLLENRQKNASKWDAYLPGEGMLVFRVDKTNSAVWSMSGQYASSNTVNANPKHNYYELMRAGGHHKDYAGNYTNDPSDTYPGTNNVTMLHYGTSPGNISTWYDTYIQANRNTRWALTNIKSTNGVVTFDVDDSYALRDLSIPESKELFVGTTVQLEAVKTPSYSQAQLAWRSPQAEVAQQSGGEVVATVDNNGCVTGVAVGECDIVSGASGITKVCHVIVKEAPVYDVASFKELNNGEKVLLSFDNAEVLYVNGSDAYVRDAKGPLMLTNVAGLGLKKNDILNGKIFAKVGAQYNVVQAVGYEQTNAQDLTVMAGPEVQPRKVYLRDLTANDYSDYVLIKEVQVKKLGSGSRKYPWAVDGDNKARLWNGRFNVSGVTIPSDYDGKYFDIHAIYGADYQNGSQFVALHLLGSPVQVEPSGAIEGDVNGDGLVTVSDITAVINVITGADMKYEATADVNNDGIVTIADITEVINNIK